MKHAESKSRARSKARRAACVSGNASSRLIDTGYSAAPLTRGDALGNRSCSTALLRARVGNRSLRCSTAGIHARVFGRQSEPVEQAAIGCRVGIARRQQLLAIENRVRAGEKTQGLQLVAEVAAARRQPNVRARQHNARNSDAA